MSAKKCALARAWHVFRSISIINNFKYFLSIILPLWCLIPHLPVLSPVPSPPGAYSDTDEEVQVAVYTCHIETL